MSTRMEPCPKCKHSESVLTDDAGNVVCTECGDVCQEMVLASVAEYDERCGRGMVFWGAVLRDGRTAQGPAERQPIVQGVHRVKHAEAVETTGALRERGGGVRVL